MSSPLFWVVSYALPCQLIFCVCLKNSEFIVAIGKAVGIATETFKRHLGLDHDLNFPSPLLLFVFVPCPASLLSSFLASPVILLISHNASLTACSLVTAWSTCPLLSIICHRRNTAFVSLESRVGKL